ncbi:MAG TPA: hypothetical protein EYP54_11400, partial [Anaerolineales bacterium]|nr:hypothetical protein [Anaerolineales bacterium]
MTTPRDFWQDPNLHIEAAPYGILVRDTQLKVRGFNHWVQVHLPDPDALAGHPLAEAFPAIAAHTINALEEVLRTGLPRILFPALHPAWPPLRHPFSSRPMQVVRAFPTTQRAGLILLLEDITKRTDYEVTLEAEVACRTTLLREREALLRALDAATRQALQAVTGLPRMGRTLTQAFRRPFRAYDALPFIMDEEERFNLLSGRGDLFLEDKPSPWHLSLSPDQQASLQRGQALWMTDIRPQLRPPKTPVTLPLRSAMLFPLRVVDERPSQPLLGVLVLTFPPRNPPPPHLETRGLVVSRTLKLIGMMRAVFCNQHH